MAKTKKSPDTTTALMDWVDSPADTALTNQARQALDERFDDPKAVFAVAELAMIHHEVSGYPVLDRIEGEIFGELFSEQRRASATNAELTAMAKLSLDKKRFAIELAGGDNVGEKPKIEIRVAPGDDNGGSAAQFTPRQRERMRRALQALTGLNGKTK
jgi:hypothetical protein